MDAWQNATAERQPTLILGEGSNVLFLKDYSGTVIINRIMGIEVRKRLTPGICTLVPEKTGINWCSLRIMHAGSGKSCIDSWLRRIFADSEYWCLRRRITGLQYVDCIELATGVQRLSR
jgi:UDP-N-acetylmuramate dehydrogenase